MASVSLQTALDQDLFDRASAKAAGEGKPLAQVAAELIRQWVGEIPPPSEEESSQAPLPTPRTYVVQSGDSLWLIAHKVYGDGGKYELIAQANNLGDNRRIFAGMTLVIPPLVARPPAPVPAPPQPSSQPPPAPHTAPSPESSPVPTPEGAPSPSADSSPAPAPGTAPAPAPEKPPSPAPVPGVAPKAGYPIVPEGLDQIKQVFGDFDFSELPGKPLGRVQIDPAWVAANIVTEHVPALGAIQCHRLLVPAFVAVFEELQAQNLATGLNYWGCFVPRHKMWNPAKDLSVHSWGIALDLNADTNTVGTTGSLDPRVIQVFADHGFYWGGNFGDPMHFQYCLSY